MIFRHFQQITEGIVERKSSVKYALPLFAFFFNPFIIDFLSDYLKKKKKYSIDLTYEQNEETSWARTLIPPVCVFFLFNIYIFSFQVFRFIFTQHNEQETKNNN